MSLVDAKLLTKPNVDAGELDGKERRSKWWFKMEACCAALGELMVLASVEELETRQDATTPNAAHSTNLFYVLSLLTDCEALDIVQNIPLNSGMEVWRRMVARWEPGVSSRFRSMLQSILFPRHDIPDPSLRDLLLNS